MRAPAVLHRVLGLGLLVWAGCVDRLDYASNVHDLRVLAIQAEPPEILVDPASPTLAAFRLRALVADAEGVVRERRFRFTTCPVSVSLTCKEGAEELLVAEGAVQSAEAVADFDPLACGFDLRKAIEDDPFHGFGGLPVTVQLHVSAGAEEVRAAKRVVLTSPMPSAPGQVANCNPPEPQLTLDGATLGATLAPELRGTEFSLDVIAPGAGEKEDYVVPTFDGRSRTLTETWSYSWFTSKGHFSPEQSGGFNVLTQDEEPTKAKLVIDDREEPGELRLWVVVRDGRGGESWTERRAVWLGR